MKLGPEVRLMPPAYVKRGKTDAVDTWAWLSAETMRQFIVKRI